MTGRRKDVTHQLLQVKDDELVRLQDQTLLLNKTAEERIAWFLVRMTARSETQKFITLPMPRKDVAEHLGLTIETVSRTMRQLESAGLIKSLSRRRIQVLNDKALRKLVS